MSSHERHPIAQLAEARPHDLPPPRDERELDAERNPSDMQAAGACPAGARQTSPAGTPAGSGVDGT
jgi:hypothetical protein